MQPQTEQMFATLEVLVSDLYFGLSGHENGGNFDPFIWDISKSGKFSALNLSLSKNWLELTDDYTIIQSWQQMQYLSCFNSFSFQADDKANMSNKIINLYHILSNQLRNIEYYKLKAFSYFLSNISVGLIIGETVDGDWISVCHTLYKETSISDNEISRSEKFAPTQIKALGKNTLNLVSEIQTITSELGAINLKGDFGGGYYYSFEYKFLYVTAESKELAIEKALQASGMLEIAKFNSFYPDKEYFEDYYQESQFAKFNKINHFLNHSFLEVMMYRFSFWTFENIYIIGKSPCDDWVGLHIESDFVYNP
jgi:Nuclease A inhibitor-like protein